MQPLFSVIVPIYNVEAYLNKCVDSILCQTFKDFELLLIDDGSPDGCPAICDAYAIKDSRVRVIHKPNGGLVSARNAGIHAASGEYICYVDGDDWIAPNLLETVYDQGIREHSADMVIFGGAKKFHNREEAIWIALPEGIYSKQQIRQSICPSMIYDDSQSFCKGSIFSAAWNKVYKRSLLQNHYCSEERIRMGEDAAFIYECVWYAETIYICNRELYYYNCLNMASMCRTYDAGRFENNQLLTTYIEQRLGGIDPVLDEQINAFKAYWLIMAVFHEIKSDRPIRLAAPHIREKIKSTGVLSDIRLTGLPLMAKAFMLLLKLRLYRLTLMASAVVNRRREQHH